jgi:hypothetical protein
MKDILTQTLRWLFGLQDSIAGREKMLRTCQQVEVEQQQTTSILPTEALISTWHCLHYMPSVKGCSSVEQCLVHTLVNDA